MEYDGRNCFGRENIMYKKKFVVDYLFRLKFDI